MPVVELVAVGAESKAALFALYEYYIHDFSELVDIDVAETGRFDTSRIDRHFTSALSHPFLVRADGKIAGFAIHEGRSRLCAPPDGVGVNDVADFFVLRKFRHQGVGERAATLLFDRFPGPWEVRQIPANVAATRFWRTIIERYTKGAYTELDWNGPTFQGVVQRFQTPIGNEPL